MAPAPDWRRELVPGRVVDEDLRRPAFCRVFWRVSSFVSSGSEIVGTVGGEVAVTGEGAWPVKELEFLRMPLG